MGLLGGRSYKFQPQRDEDNTGCSQNANQGKVLPKLPRSSPWEEQGAVGGETPFMKAVSTPGQRNLKTAN